MKAYLALLLVVAVMGCRSSTQLRLDESHSYTHERVCSATHFDSVWTDGARSREIPVRIYLPSCGGRAPVVLFSHGIANSGEGYGFLAEAWARAGYVVVGVTHHGSDRALLEKEGALALYRSTKNPQHWIDRSNDLRFVLDRLDAINSGSFAEPRLSGRTDTSRVAAAGHSFGAFTVLTLGGFLVGKSEPPLDFTDARVKSVVALSTPKLEGPTTARAFRHVQVPVLHMTGTRDWSLLFRTRTRDRLVPFRSIPFSPQELVVLKDAGHSSFSNDERRPSINRELHVRAMQEATIAWFDFTLRDRREAKRWLTSEAPLWLNGAARVETK